MTVTLTILVLAVIAFLSNRIPAGIIAIGVSVALWATGVLSLNTALSGFGDPTVIFIATLFVVAEGLNGSGVTEWIGQQVMGRAGTRKTRLLVLVMIIVALATAFLGVNGAVLALIPVAVVVSTRIGMPTSRLLLPLVFAAQAGSMLALTGTPVNIIVSGLAVDSGENGFSYFEFALAGIPLVIGTILITLVFGGGILPSRVPKLIPQDLSDQARSLLRQYALPERVARLTVGARSSLAGVQLDSVDLSEYGDLRILRVQSGYGEDRQNGPISAGDVIVVRGANDAVRSFAKRSRLRSSETATDADAGEALAGRPFGLAEVVIAPGSSLMGTRVFAGMVTRDGDLVIRSVHRSLRDLGVRETTLAVGDTLVLQGTWNALDERTDGASAPADATEPSQPAPPLRLALPAGTRWLRAVIILAAMVILLVIGVLPISIVGLLAAGAMILTRTVSVGAAYRSVSWTTVVLVAGLIPLSTAFIRTGTAQLLANGLINLVGQDGPLLVLFSFVVITVILGQFMSSTAVVLIVAPIALAVASDLGVSARPFLVALTIAGAASFLTPLAAPANLMVMRPGAYRAGDYWKLGLPILLFFVIVATFYVPLIWKF